MSQEPSPATPHALTREQIEGYRTLCVADIGILCDMALKCLRLNSFYSPTGESPDEWYEREKAAFRTWWEDEGEKTFSGTPTLAAGAGWFARAEAAPETAPIVPCLAPNGCTTPEWCARNGDACRVKTPVSEIAQLPDDVVLCRKIEYLSHTDYVPLSDAPGAAGKAGSHLDMVKAPAETARSATRPICPFCNPAALYANPANTRAEAAALQSTRKRCATCPYPNGCIVGDCND